VCGLHRAQGDEECGFLDLASNPRSTVYLSLPQNWCLWVSRFGPQNRQVRFSDLDLKITVTVS
jgi:hypothetical protein